MDLGLYRQSPSEKARTEDLLRLVPAGRQSVLEIGARDGHFSRLLAGRFEAVTALDLTQPAFSHDRVTTVAGDVRDLPYPDDSFDSVFCTEVLEHVAPVEKACGEIDRVARWEILIGVPYRQDTRIGRTTCARCGRTNPPSGHVNTFTFQRLRSLFPRRDVIRKSLVGEVTTATNAVAAMLSDWAGNPWGTYDQDEPCIHCGAKLVAPSSRSLSSRTCSKLAHLAEWPTRLVARPHANWIHVLFSARCR